MSADSVAILGVPIHVVDFDGALDRVDDLVAAGRITGNAAQVVTVNTDFLVSGAGDPSVHSILQNADLAFADGMPVVWASKILGEPLPTRVAGADFVPALAARSADRGYRIMFFGGAADTAAQAAKLLSERHDGLVISSATGPVGEDGLASDELIHQISDFAPDIVCVGLGHPKQEHFIRRHCVALGVPVSIGVGATFEFVCGGVDRAPAWMQRFGLEWFHRMVRDPRRLVRRYGKDALVFFPRLMRQKLITAAPRPRLHPALDLPANARLIDLTSVRKLSSPDVVALSSVATRCRAVGRHPSIAGANQKVRRQLDQLQLSSLFINEAVPAAEASESPKPKASAL